MVGWVWTGFPKLLVSPQSVEQGGLAGVREAEDDDLVVPLGAEELIPKTAQEAAH